MPYKLGEYTNYNISFGPLEVGSGELMISSICNINNKTSYHIIGKGRTSSFFDVFFKVRDVYETYIDTNTLLPTRFIRDVNEGGYNINKEYIFFPYSFDTISGSI